LSFSLLVDDMNDDLSARPIENEGDIDSKGTRIEGEGLAFRMPPVLVASADLEQLAVSECGEAIVAFPARLARGQHARLEVVLVLRLVRPELHFRPCSRRSVLDADRALHHRSRRERDGERPVGIDGQSFLVLLVTLRPDDEVELHAGPQDEVGCPVGSAERTENLPSGFAALRDLDFRPEHGQPRERVVHLDGETRFAPQLEVETVLPTRPGHAFREEAAGFDAHPAPFPFSRPRNGQECGARGVALRHGIEKGDARSFDGSVRIPLVQSNEEGPPGRDFSGARREADRLSS
jgi:hypothetical protein